MVFVSALLGCGGATASARVVNGDTQPPSSVAPAPTEWWSGGADCHVHIAPEGYDHAADGNAVLEVLQETGLAHACVLSSAYRPPCEAEPCPERSAVVERNDWVLAQAVEHPALLPFCGIPLGLPWSADEARRCSQEGARGFKLHPVSQEVSLLDPTIRDSLGDILAVAGATDTVVLIHVAFEPDEVAAFYEIAAAHPTTTIIVAHQLGPLVASLLDAPAHVLTELSGLSMISVQQAESLLPLWRAFGMHRILLGSDWPTLEPSAHISVLDALPLTPEERAMLAHGNFERIFAE